ncbi:hypothetical protein SLEP1_g41357 [Rubroshorea leprosula]|uniref:Uncharacterized protein n=1 Tax=Rubroshorea leprosula TaxID=152421 RepID=A0AAV5L6Q2_9ROSI|nr:hypothetical protein SLEP1_g41357 [Rubroshorea leprosula]
MTTSSPITTLALIKPSPWIPFPTGTMNSISSPPIPMNSHFRMRSSSTTALISLITGGTKSISSSISSTSRRAIPGFGVIDGTHELDMDDLELDLGLGFGSVETHYGNFGFVVETIGGSDVEVDVGGDDDDFPVERRVSGLASNEVASTVGGVEVKLEPTGKVLGWLVLSQIQRTMTMGPSL